MQAGPKPSFFFNKCILVTGASSGIGRTLAFWYLNNGAKVALVGRDMVELENIGKLYPA
jgi:NADP-dependent 3-hydroxy acid dehydrogenase YdfG